jgi:hypothetical protein
LTILIIFLLVAVSGQEGQQAIIGIVGYALLLVNAYGPLNILTSGFAGFNRFLPQFRRIVELLQARELMREKTGTQAGDELHPEDGSIHLCPMLDGSREGLKLQPGEIVFCWSTRHGEGSDLNRLANSILGATRDKNESALFVPEQWDIPDWPLRALMCGVGIDRKKRETFESLRQLQFLNEDIDALNDGIDTSWNDAKSVLRDASRFAIAMGPAFSNRVTRIFVDFDAWSGVGCQQFREICDLAPSAIVFLYSEKIERMEYTCAEMALAFDGTDVVAIGAPEWIKENATRLDQSGEKTRRRGLAGVAVKEEDDEDDDDG